MELSIRPLSKRERKYTFAQSTQLQGQTGCIGYLRGDFDKNGKGFYSSWFDQRSNLKEDAFKAEFDEVINTLRSDAYGLLKDRSTMAIFARKEPDSEMTEAYCTQYGFRTDTEKYAYFIRCNPVQGDYNFYCYCYKKEWLDKHLENAERGIRFIDPHYKEQFVIPDGDTIRILMENDKYTDYACRYIDDYHLEVGSQLYHICQFAEIMEQNGYKVIPLRSSLPEQCFSTLPSTGELILITKGKSGYAPCYDFSTNSEAENKEFANDRNANKGITKAQVEAMVAGSMFGWHTPAADPKNYDDNGNPIKPKRKNKEIER